jgi:DNA-binding MarR family transcriptional regulator
MARIRPVLTTGNVSKPTQAPVNAILAVDSAFHHQVPCLSPAAVRGPRVVSSGDMSRNGEASPAPAGGWLDRDQQRAWLAYIRVQLRLTYEMNRQLLADSGMSLADYDVLTALSVADGGRMPITVLAAQIGWERSRVSHHVRRMSARGLVTCGLSAVDRRVTEVAMTGRGRQALEEAAPGHVDLVRRLFFEGLPEGLVGPLSEALESVYANIIKRGSLPPPVDWHPAED